MRNVDIAAPTFVVPENEPTQSSYVGGTRRTEAQTDDSEPVMKTAFAYGPAGPEGKPGRDSTVPGPAGRDGRDGHDARITLGKVEAADEAKAILEDTPAGQVLHLRIPRGERGIQGAVGQDGKSITGSAGRDGADGKSIVGPQGKSGVDGRPGRDADPAAIIAQATKFLEDAFHGFKAEVRSALSETVVAQLKSSGVIDANGKAILIPGPRGEEGLRGPEGKPPDLSRCVALAERATRAEMVAMKDDIRAELRTEIMKELEEIKCLHRS